MDATASLIATTLSAGTPLLLAATGILVSERSGVVNLGIEGMMLMAALAGFAVTHATGHYALGFAAGALAGMAMALLFSAFAIGLATNQYATGLALALLGAGLSAFLGQTYQGLSLHARTADGIPGLRDLPFLGEAFFSQHPVVYLSLALTAGVAWFLFRTRAGLTLRAIGDNHDSAHALGIKVLAIRYGAVAFGGACAGLAGAHLTLVYTPQWIENMTAGRGWIALALVVFASWRPWRVLAGAYLFGAVSIGQLHAQAIGLGIPSQLLSSLPYLATILVLVVISQNRRLTLINTPASLGRPFVPDR